MTAADLCLALNLFFEAGTEPALAQRAVAHVTLNRAHRTGQSVCRTVFAPHQFSWTRHRWHYPTGWRWRRSRLIAQQVQIEPDFTYGAWLYHRHDIKPRWASHYRFVGQWGRHRFYK